MATLQRERSVNTAVKEKCNPDGIFHTLDGIYTRGQVQQIPLQQRVIILVCVIPTPKKLPQNKNDWISAITLSTIYINKFPCENDSLLKYGEVVRQIASEGGILNLYDVNFRKQRQVTDLPYM